MSSFSRVHNPFKFPLFFLILNLISLTQIKSRIVINPNSQFKIPSRISYSQHCSQLIPNSNPTKTPLFTTQVPTFTNAYVINGDQFLGPTSQITATLTPTNLFTTTTNGVFKLDATLLVRVVRFRPQTRNLINVYGGPRFRFSPKSLRFRLSGFWDSGSGHLCMVGLGTKRSPDGKTLDLDVVFKSNYPNNSMITSSLVTATLESLSSSVSSSSYFKPVSMMGFARTNYEYTLIKQEIDHGFESVGSNALLNVSDGLRSCYHFASLSENFELGYMSSCDGRNCSRLDVLFGFLPRFMSLNEIDCSGDRMVRVAFSFSNVSDVRHGYRQPLDPSRVLVAEGGWNDGNNQLRFVACRILNFTDSSTLGASVGDCSIRLNFSFPAFLTIRTPSVVNGDVWSNKSVGESGYFDRSEIRASGAMRSALSEMKYEYTEIDRVNKYCAEKKELKRKGKIFPDPYSQDMKFDMDVRNSKGEAAWGKAYAMFVGDRVMHGFYPFFRSSVLPGPNSDGLANITHDALVNITYQITFSPRNQFMMGGQSFTQNQKIIISAEGIYDTGAGRLCMVGCWNREVYGNMALNTSKLDCDIFINIQFPPQDSNGGDVVKGTIESKRESSDPLYFNRVDLSATSPTKMQVDSAFWRMDFEIIMVLISNTLTCIFVGLQLFHVKRQPDALPFISVVMLVVITLGHMIPLLLNMEALFLSSPSKRTVLFGSGGWLEVNEVLVRVITMVAFLLEFRLLQLTWSSRGDESNSSPKSLWASEKKVICYSLPLYASGALIAWFIQKLRVPTRMQFRHVVSTNSTPTLWRDIKSYGGFVLDVFLLPQIMFNIFSNSKDTPLSLPYYLGTTIVRLLPHGYDLFRAHSSAWKFDAWYIYANPGMNYYSTAWDVLISCLGLVFVIVIYLQQRFGGQAVVPRRFRQNVEYEKVPVGL